MANPAAASDTRGEWFELKNTTAAAVDLQGLIVHDDGLDRFPVETTLIVSPGGYVVFGASADTSKNGGYTPDYVYTDFALGNAGDELVIEGGLGVYDRLSLTELNGFFFPSGASLQLRPHDQTSWRNNRGDAWCSAPSPWAGSTGDLGSPGGPSAC